MVKKLKIARISAKVFTILLLTICFLELFIRFSGIYFNFSEKNNRTDSGYQKTSKATRTILILGDSTAVMAGDKTNRYLAAYNSYPKHLEDYLNKTQNKFAYKVVNLSQMNGNSYRVLKDLKQFQKIYQPNVIITMLGLIDGQNVSQIKIGQEEKSSLLEKYSRLYQWIKFVAEDQRQKEKPMEHAGSQGFNPLPIVDSIRFIGGETNKNFDFPQFDAVFNGHISACTELNKSQFQNAAEQFLALYHKYGVGKFGYIQALLHMGKFEEAEKELKELIKHSPKNPFFYSSLISLYVQKNDPAKFNEIKKQSEQAFPESSINIDISLAQALRAENKNFQSNAMLEKMTKKLSLDLSNKAQPRDVRKISSDPKFARALYDNIESNDVYKMLFDGLAEVKDYKKLDSYLNFFTANHPWIGTAFYYLLENYVLYGQNDKSKTLLEHISREMSNVSDYYRLIVYYSHMNKKMDPQITQRFHVLFKNTLANFEYLYNSAKQENTPLVVMQYPGFNNEISKLFINKPDVYYMSNENVFNGVAPEKVIFEPRYPFVRNHYTENGARLIAKNLGDYLLANKLLE